MNRQQRRIAEAFRRQLPKTLTPVPIMELEASEQKFPPFAAWRSRYFVVLAYAERDFIVRLSVCRATRSGDRWEDGISWDELQAIKAQVGYGHRDAVEIYPRDRDVVDVANMRHLWVMRDAIPFAWRTDP